MKSLFLTLTALFTGSCVAIADDAAPSVLNVSEDFGLLPGFEVERLYDVPDSSGSWVSIAQLPDGRLITADQYGALYSVTAGEQEVAVEQLELDLKGACGLLWHGDSLYVTVNEGKNQFKGVYRTRDLDGNGSFESIEKFTGLKARGEHGVHSLVASPDGQWIYLIAGNRTSLPDYEKSWIPEVWAEDHLLPRNPDGRGHGKELMAPGGWIARFKPDGTQWELVAGGFRNPFDMAFNENGDLFAYDADMEWDLGMPWYRPTRLCQIIPGAEYGWRNGTGKWPAYYEDSMEAVIDIGPGSPTGVLSGKGAAFPAKYQKAIYLYDWTFATIYAVHLQKDGSGYQAEREEFLTGKGLPLTDGVIASDGAMYFLTGGRKLKSALWRIRYTGDESTSPAWEKSDDAEVVADLDSEVRNERFAARVALERDGVEKVLVASPETPLGIANRSIALARLGKGEHSDEALKALLALDFPSLKDAEKLGWLRAAALVFSRGGEPSADHREQVIAAIDPSYPYNSNDDVNAELCRVLSYLQAPKVVSRTLAIMARPGVETLPDWAQLITRNAEYGADIAKTLREAPPARKIHLAYCLRVVKGPWTEGQRRQIMEWYAEVEGKQGGKSYALFLKRMKKDTLDNATEAEREMIAGWGLEVQTSPFANLPRPLGPGRAWTVDEVVAVTEDLSGANRENGEKMFRASLCMACHRVGGQGGASGPDLSTVGGRFTIRAMAEAIIHPSKEVSDQFEFSTITKIDGSSVYGKILDEKDEVYIIATSAYDLSQTIELDRRDVKSIEPSKVSPMPPALINQLNEQELKDMIAWLMKA